MGIYLETEAGVKCAYDETPRFIQTNENESQYAQLALLDCLGRDVDGLRSGHGLERFQDVPHFFVALFNVDVRRNIEMEALRLGARGIFYDNDPLGRLAKGIGAILNGELWFRRKFLAERLFEMPMPMQLAVKTDGLTVREKEILHKIGTGASNAEIARELSISYYTVKTHIYKIFKKIGVSSRVEAALLGAKVV
jgi:LuxR family transcriptional regulator of csgAB operon